MLLPISLHSAGSPPDNITTQESSHDMDDILSQLKVALNDPNLSCNERLEVCEWAIAESDAHSHEDQAEVRLYVFFYFSFRILEFKEEFENDKSFDEILRVMQCLNSCVSQRLILFVDFHDYTLPLVLGVLPELQASPYQAIAVLNETAKDESSSKYRRNKEDFTYIYDTLADEIEYIRNP